MPPLHSNNRQLDLVEGKSIFDYADTLKIRVPTSCGRSGECHECIVDIRRGIGALTPPTEAEGFLRGVYRLACQARISDPSADVEFAALRRQPRILTDSVRRAVDLDPMVVRRGDGVFRTDKRIDDYRGGIYGIAVDVGTTTVVMNLAELESGELIYTASFENPQRFGGSDIMHRISYDSGEFHGELQQVILSAINFEIGDMCRRLKIRRRHIYDMVVVGNSTMRDIFFGIDVQSIGEKPYKSLTEFELDSGTRDSTSITVNSKELGLRIFPAANVYSGPIVRGHVGADVAADLLAIGMDQQEDSLMLIDVGTNTEVIVGNKDYMLAASCPAGPAFEGGQVTYGMPGYEGAVEKVKLEGDSCTYVTIGGGEPQGICGSGLVDLLAELRRSGKMNPLGVFENGVSEFFFAPDKGMYISRADVSALAQAKSANYSGQWIVLRKYGVPLNQISRLCLAGGFANYLDTSNAIEVGFIANLHTSKIEKVGNAALEGATLMLLSREMRGIVEEMVRRVEHVELESIPDFFDIFVEGCLFKPMNTTIA